MIPVSPVMPGSKPIEKIWGEGKTEYLPLPAVHIDSRARNVITRWRMDDEERAAIAAGADIVLQQLTFELPYQPVNLQVVMPDEMPVLVQDPTE